MFDGLCTLVQINVILAARSAERREIQWRACRSKQESKLLPLPSTLETVKESEINGNAIK